MLSTAGALEDVGKKLGFSKKSEFPIRGSGYWTCEAPIGSCVYWLDNDRVIFNGAKPGDMEALPDGRSASKHAIYIWDLKTNTVSKYTDAARSVLCYADGYIRYARKDGAYDVVLAGPFGKEVELSRTHDKDRFAKRGEEITYLNRFSCRTYKQSEISPLPGARIPLKDGNGFLYLGTRNSADNRKKAIVYYPPNSERGTELPISRWQVNPFEITRTRFNNSYVLAGDQIFGRSDRCVPKGFSRTVYRLRMPGVIETIALPSRDELRCHVEVGGISEVRTGITVYINSGKLETSHFYLTALDEVKEVVQGWISDLGVSPDGCRVAVGISSKNDPLKPPTAPSYRGHLKVIEFCERGGK